MRIKQSLIKLIPPAYYSNGKESNCAVYRICNMFDINSQSFKEVKEKKRMESKHIKARFTPYNEIKLTNEGLE